MRTSALLLSIFCAVSAVTFLLYGIDKWKAKHRRWRVRESVLLGLTFLGGASGAILGMMLFRHKTKHWYFTATAVLGLAWQVALLLWLRIGQGL